MSSVLTCYGILIPNGTLSDTHMKKIRRILTISVKTFSGYVKRTYGFTQGVNHFIVPRFTPLPRGVNLVVTNTLRRGYDRRAQLARFMATPTDNQSAVLAHIMGNMFTTDSMKLGKAGVIVDMEPGQGKTFLAMAVMSALGRKTAIIVPRSYLQKQWAEICRKYLPDASIGTYDGKVKTDGDVVILVINSAVSDTFTFGKGADVKSYPSHKFWSRFGLIVYDEVHMYCSESRAEIFRNAQAPYMLGLSATPDSRLDLHDPLAVWSVGPILKSSTIAGYSKDEVGYRTSTRVIKYECKTKFAETILSAVGTVSVPLMINNFVVDPDRNRIIIEEAMRLYDLGLCIFVFTDRRGHAEYLTDELRRYKYELGRDRFRSSLPPGIMGASSINTVYDYLYPADVDAISLLGGSSDADIRTAKGFSRIIVTTYAYSSTGVSIDKLNAAILATPRKNGMCQILGRIYRLSGDASVTRRIVDIVDWGTPLKKQYYTRRKEYLKKGEIETVNVVSAGGDI